MISKTNGCLADYEHHSFNSSLSLDVLLVILGAHAVHKLFDKADAAVDVAQVRLLIVKRQEWPRAWLGLARSLSSSC